MTRGAAALLCATLLGAACASAPAAPSGAVAVATPTPTAARTASPSPTPSASATPKPSPLVSARGAITVNEPRRGEEIGSPLVIAGEASVFEATLRWRLVTASGAVLAEGNTLASAGAPQKGTFKTSVSFATPYYGEPGFVEVFEVSPKDGSISEIVRVPVAIAGSY